MKVSSEFMSHLSSYLDGRSDLRTFREWYLPLLLDREKLGPDDQGFLLAVEARYGETLAGVPEESFKEALRNLLSQEVRNSPVHYSSESWTKSTVTVMFYDPAPAPDQSAFPVGSGATIPQNYVDLVPA